MFQLSLSFGAIACCASAVPDGAATAMARATMAARSARAAFGRRDDRGAGWLPVDAGSRVVSILLVTATRGGKFTHFICVGRCRQPRAAPATHVSPPRTAPVAACGVAD